MSSQLFAFVLALMWPALSLTLLVVMVTWAIYWLRVTDPRWIHAAYILALLQGLLIIPSWLELPQSPRLAKWLFQQTSDMPDVVTESANSVLPHLEPQNGVLLSAGDELGCTTTSENSVEVLVSSPLVSRHFGSSIVDASSASNDGTHPEKAVTERSNHFDTPFDRPNRIRSGQRSTHTPTNALATVLTVSAMCLIAIWVSGMLQGLWQLFCDGWSIHRVLASTADVPLSWRQEVIDQAKMRDIKRIPHIRRHATLGPLLCPSWRGAVLILPTDVWPRLPPAERAVILGHELAHFKRGDLYWLLIARCATLLHWFNPLAHYAARKSEEAAEWACDAWTTRYQPESSVYLAKALVRFLDREQPRVLLTSAMEGVSMKVRILRLVSGKVAESRWRKWVLCGCLAAASMLGVCRWRFFDAADRAIAAEPAATATMKPADSPSHVDLEKSLDPETRFKNHVADLANQIQDEGREALQRFREALATEAGQTVVRGRMGNFEWQVREEYRQHGLEKFVEQNLVESQGRLDWKPDRNEFRQEFLQDAESYEQDLQSLSQFFNGVADAMSPETEAEKLIARVLRGPGFAVRAYQDEIRRRVRPSLARVEERLGQALVKNRQGKYVIPPSAKDELQQRMKRWKEEERELPRLTQEFSHWSDDLVAKDELHQRVKELFKEPEFATFALVQTTYDHSDTTVEQQTENLFNSLEENTQESAEGLVLTLNDESQLSEVIRKYEQSQANAHAVMPILAKIANHIAPADEATPQSLADYLRSPLSAYRLVKEADFTAGDVVGAAKMLLPRLVTEENGEYQLSEEAAANAQQIAEEMGRGEREIRRRGRKFDDLADRVNDEDFATALRTSGGKLLIAAQIQDEAERLSVDAFPIWRDSMFEATPQGYVLKEEQSEELDNMLKEIEDMRQELAKNDF